MESTLNQEQIYVAFLRGINVGGRHKVPMPELFACLKSIGFSEITTLLNSGNVIFKTKSVKENVLETSISRHLEGKFGFPIPVLIRKMEVIKHLVSTNPFREIEVHKDLRLYISFLRSVPKEEPDLPWISPDGGFHILVVHGDMLAFALDVSITKTTEGMRILEKKYTKDITTRNWNTLQKIANLR